MNPAMMDLTRSVLQTVVQLSYVWLTAYAIRQLFIYLKAWLDVKGKPLFFPSRSEVVPDAPVDLLDTPKDVPSGLSLRSN